MGWMVRLASAVMVASGAAWAGDKVREVMRVRRGRRVVANATASWSAAALRRFGAHRLAESARGLAHSKTWRPFERSAKSEVWARATEMSGELPFAATAGWRTRAMVRADPPGW
jgi:hypothetical protein